MIFGGRRPVVCLVTDRHRTAPQGATPAEQHRALLALIADAAAADVTLIYIRESDLPAHDLHALVLAAVALTRGTNTRIVVGDRADVALSAGADGVHLAAGGAPVERIRALGPAGWLVGRSAHSPAELALASSADYVVFGTVFATDSKPGVEGQGITALADATRAVDIPVLAIGGVTLERARVCLTAGAAGIAAISLFVAHAPGGVGPRMVVEKLRQEFMTH